MRDCYLDYQTLILSCAKIETVSMSELTNMLRKREKNKHTLVYYLFLKKKNHNEWTDEEKLLIEKEEKKALQTTEDSVKKPVVKKKLQLGQPQIKVMNNQGAIILPPQREPEEMGTDAPILNVKETVSPLKKKATLRSKKQSISVEKSRDLSSELGRMINIGKNMELESPVYKT